MPARPLPRRSGNGRKSRSGTFLSNFHPIGRGAHETLDQRRIGMAYRLAGFLAAAALAFAGAAVAADGPTDPQIAHIAYTAGNIDVAAAKQALAKTHNSAVREFAREMVRDHEAVNDKALALVKELKVTPEDNSTSQALTKAAG